MPGLPSLTGDVATGPGCDPGGRGQTCPPARCPHHVSGRRFRSSDAHGLPCSLLPSEHGSGPEGVPGAPPPVVGPRHTAGLCGRAVRCHPSNVSVGHARVCPGGKTGESGVRGGRGESSDTLLGPAPWHRCRRSGDGDSRHGACVCGWDGLGAQRVWQCCRSGRWEWPCPQPRGRPGARGGPRQAPRTLPAPARRFPVWESCARLSRTDRPLRAAPDSADT